MKIYVHYESYCEDSDREGGEQGRWEEHWFFDIYDVSTIPSNKHDNEQFDLDAEFKRGDIAHVLYATWDSGDSYGHSRGHGEVLWVFKDRLLAEEALKRWQYACDVHGDWRHGNKQQFASFRVDGGEIRKMGNPVFGYFEHLNTLALKTMVVQ